MPDPALGIVSIDAGIGESGPKACSFGGLRGISEAEGLGQATSALLPLDGPF